MLPQNAPHQLDSTAPPRDLFAPISQCWVCRGRKFALANEERLDFGNLLTVPELEILRDYHGHRFPLNRCRGCGFMQPAVLPSRPGFFDAIYNMKWSEEWMEGEFVNGYKDFIFRIILGTLEKRVPVRPRALLDVGTHVGRMLELARQAGWKPEGIELNPQTAAFAAARTSLPIHRKNAEDLAATGVRFDAVVLTDVLEHIPDPISVLNALRGLMNPGGWVAVKVPCGENQLFKQRIRSAVSDRQDPGIATNFVHVNHFGPRSLSAALRRAGFDAVRVGIGAPELPPGGGVKGFGARAFRSAVYRVARSLPFGTRTPLTMNLQAYARNPTA